MIKNFIEDNNFEYYVDASLKRYNTYRLDTKCRYLVFPKNKEEVRELVKFLVENDCLYVVLGNGSNVIFQESYYDGVVVLLNKLNQVEFRGEVIEVGAGYSLQKLALETASKGLQGLEFASGIPGNVGASIAMNAGAYKSSLSEVVETVLVLNPDFEFVTMSGEDLGFEYRNSMFKNDKRYIILSAVLHLQLGVEQEILGKISRRRVKRIETQPLDMPSAGSVFRNPPDGHAGELIERCGLKGYTIGGAQVSLKHANFIVNAGGATGKDIVELIEYVHNKVYDNFGVDLILEQIIVN